MLLLNIRIALRNFLRNRLFSFINIFGLALGLAAGLFVILMIYFETSFDNFHPDSDRLYRLTEHFKTPSKEISSGICWEPIAAAAAEEIPGISSFCRVGRFNERTIKYQQKKIKVDNLLSADSVFFNIFGFKLLEGNPRQVLKAPYQIVITSSLARKIYGNMHVIGKTLLINENEYTITGIAADPLQNSHLQFDAIFSHSTLKHDPSVHLSWDGGQNFLSYIKLARNTKPETVESDFDDFLYTHVNRKFEKSGWKMSLFLQNVKDIHLHSSYEWDFALTRPAGFLRPIILVGFLILFLAIINYINLSTALTGLRQKEAGIRKIFGASEARVKLQIITESFVMVFLSIILAVLLFKLVAPVFNQLLESNISLEQYPWHSFSILLLLALFTGIVSGIIPSVIFSRGNTIDKLKNKTFSFKQPLRNMLVVLQFIAATILIILILVIDKQYNYLMHRNLGFNEKNILAIVLPPDLKEGQKTVLKEEILKNTMTVSASFTSQLPGREITSNGYIPEGSKQSELINCLYVDDDFIDTYGIKLLKGRLFHKGLDADNRSIIVNETLVRKTGWKDPLQKTIERNGITYNVIGVVKDFYFESMLKPVSPLIISRRYNPDGWNFNYLSIRYQTPDIKTYLKEVSDNYNSVTGTSSPEYLFIKEYLKENYTALNNDRKLMSMFSFIALLIACFGILGLSVFINNRRTKEIGIRKVNGASTLKIMALLLRNFSLRVFIAFIAGMPIAWYLAGKWLQDYAYHITISPKVFLLSGIVIFSTTILTVGWQTWKAASQNPVDSLRYE